MGWKGKKVFGLAFFLHSFFLISKVGCITSRNKLQFPCISWTRNGNQSRYFLWLSRKHCESSKIHKLSDIFYDFIDFLPKSIQTLAQTQKKSQKTKSIHWIKKKSQQTKHICAQILRSHICKANTSHPLFLNLKFVNRSFKIQFSSNKSRWLTDRNFEMLKIFL